MTVEKIDQKKDLINRKINKATHIARSAKSGRYIVVRPKMKGAESSETVTVKPSRSLPSPKTFIEEFTSHPVVDRVMRRLSR